MNRTPWLIAIALLAISALEFAALGAGVLTPHAATASNSNAPLAAATAAPSAPGTPTPAAPQPATAGEVVAAATGSIGGVVTNLLGTPIAGAFVFASADLFCCPQATTAANGTYTLVGVDAAQYRVQVEAPGYAPEFYNDKYDYSAANLVAVAAGPVSNINFALAPAAQIAGKVTNALGTPIADAQISANTAICCGSGFASTAADGTYLVTDIPPGDYTVHAYAFGFAQAFFDKTYNFDDATLVHATSGATTGNIDFHLATGSHITGKITNALGTPIADVEVSAESSPCCASGSANTAADGTYDIGDLAAVPYHVQASTPNCYPDTIPACTMYATEYYNDTYNYSASTLVGITTPGQTVPNINFSLAVAGAISGKVTDALGTPVAGADVTGGRIACCNAGYATTADDGTYLIWGLPTGNEVVSANRINCPQPGACTLYPSWFSANTCEYASAAQVPVTSGVITPNINIILKPQNPDCFDHAIVANTLPFADTRSTAGSTTAPGEPLPCGNAGATDWYQYTAPDAPATASSVSIDSVGSAFNTTVAVYSQGVSPPGVLALVACKAVGSTSFVTFTAAPGMRYYFQVGGQNGATGALKVNVSPDTDGDGYTNIEETRLGENPSTYCNIMRADVDDDGAVSILDFAGVGQYFLKNVTPSNARANQDGDTKISILDLATMSVSFLKHAGDCP